MPCPRRLGPSEPGRQSQHRGVFVCLVRAASKPFSLTADSESGLIWQTMGGEVANTSLLTRCQGSFCSCWVTVSSIDLPDTGQYRVKHPHGKVPEGSAASQEGPRHAPLSDIGSWGLGRLSPPPLERQLAPSSMFCMGLLSPARCSPGSAQTPGEPGKEPGKEPAAPGGSEPGKTSPCGQRGIRALVVDIRPGWRERPRLGGASGSAAVNSAGTASGWEMDIKREAEGRQPERRSGSCLRLPDPARPCPACPYPASPAGFSAARASSSERLRAESAVGAVGTGKCLQRSLGRAGAARRAAAGFAPRRLPLSVLLLRCSPPPGLCGAGRGVLLSPLRR